jgi:hypothetical protein
VNSRWRYPVLLAVLVTLLVGGWKLYDFGKLSGVIELASTRTENTMLESRNRALAHENDRMREKLAILERSSQIDREAAQAVKSDLGQLEDELQAAREEVEFYRGIVSPGDVNPGLRIHRFTLDAGGAAGSYHYDLVLTQLKRNDRFVSGRVDWKIFGTRAGKPAQLDLAGITDPEVSRLKFRFRYFQDLAGEVRLPEGFVADHVELTVTPEGTKAQPPVVQKFNWP